MNVAFSPHIVEKNLKNIISFFLKKVWELNWFHCPKQAPTFVRPTAPPFSHLFSVGGCAQFVSDYVFYRPMAATAGEGGFPEKTIAKKDFPIFKFSGSDSQGNVDPWEPPVMAASPSR